jgi:cell division protease FtsH
MAEPQHSSDKNSGDKNASDKHAGDRAKKPRPFGSFLLTITVLVVVLIAFGGTQLTGPTKWTQDQFYNQLISGNIQSYETKGTSEIVGVRHDGDTFIAKFPNVANFANEWREIKARARYQPIRPALLLSAMEKGLFKPDEYWQVTQLEPRPVAPGGSSKDGGTQKDGDGSRSASQDSGSDTSVRSSDPSAMPRQKDQLYVFGTAVGSDGWNPMDVPSGLPRQAGHVAFRVNFVDSSDEEIVGALAALDARGVSSRRFTFDLSSEGGTTHGPAENSLGNILILWGPWILIFAVFLLFMRQMRSQGSGAGVMSFGRSRAQMYTKENHTGVTFEDVAGAQEAKAEVREVVEFLKNPGRFTRIGGRIPRGVLLVGSPGCGKTLLAKAIAGEAEVPFFSISGSDFVEMFVGVGASRVRDLFKQARENSPCIIFLDEIDAVGRRRGSGMGGGHDEREQTLNAILVEMDGFSTDEGVIVVAATNRPDVLDPALLRPGRFDREVTIDLPDLEGRQQILEVHLRKVKKAMAVDSLELAKATPGYSGADLAAIVNEAAIMAVLDKKDEIEMVHLEEATAKVRYGRRKISRNIEKEDLEITAIHEAGHTIVAARIDDVEEPHKVTIVPRGRALGATFMLPEKESYHTQKKRLLGRLAMMFGGRVAEELYCGDISAGASDDIRRATELARAMVTELGMSEKIGPINYAERQGSDFLGTELMSGKWHSEETAREIDQEIGRILREALALARKIVAEEGAAIRRLTDALLKYETLDKAEIRRLIEGADPHTLRPEPAVPVEERKPRVAVPQPAPHSGATGVEGGGLSSGFSPA